MLCCLARRLAQLLSDSCYQRSADTAPCPPSPTRRKIKRSSKRGGAAGGGDGGSEDDDSDLDGSSDGSGDGDDDEEWDEAGGGPEVCPPGCEQAVYDRVCELREARLDEEDAAAEVARAAEGLRKEREVAAKKVRLVEQSLAAINTVGGRAAVAGERGEPAAPHP